ncbi:hypothetical protein [Virgibacillus sp. CBA3643]|uniref:hypothetical protein n=1 Tax=Virgibacillus sp. CBA3643 TaxID=2942278 RepID=UPI0035A28F97
MANFNEFNVSVPIQETSKTVEAVEVSLVSDDLEGEAYITDLMLQGGSISTVWVYHPSEIRWSHDG